MIIVCVSVHWFYLSCSVHLGAADLRTRELKTMKRSNQIVRKFIRKKIERKSHLWNRQKVMSNRLRVYLEC